MLVPGGEEATAARAAEAVLREMQAGLPGYTFALGRSRMTDEPAELPRAASEALLAANVAQGVPRRRRARLRADRRLPAAAVAR